MAYFTVKEFKCPCCGISGMSPSFMGLLICARGIAQVPFVITSGRRCPKHNKFIGGSPTSAHLAGMAADIACANSGGRYKIIRALLSAGFHRIGVGKDFIHVDNDHTKPYGVIWVY